MLVEVKVITNGSLEQVPFYGHMLVITCSITSNLDGKCILCFWYGFVARSELQISDAWGVLRFFGAGRMLIYYVNESQESDSDMDRLSDVDYPDA